MQKRNQVFLITFMALFLAVGTGGYLPSIAEAATTPSIAWTTPSQVVSGTTTLTAVSSPSDGAQITEWCLTVNGAPVTSNDAETNSIPNVTNKANPALFLASTGCWLVTNGEAISFGYGNLSGQGVFQFNTTTWPNANYTFQLQVWDTSGASASSPV